MIPYTPPQNPKRDQLAGQVQEAKWWPETLLRGGSKSADDIRTMARDLKDKGATPEEIYHETGRHVDPDTETGLVHGAAGDWQFQTSDKGARLTPGALAYLNPGGSTHALPLRDLLSNEMMYDRDPSIGNVTTQLNQLDVGDTHRAGGQYTEPWLGGPAGGEIKAWGKIGTDPSGPDEFSVRNILMHEPNHYTQWKYDLPRGGTENTQGLDKFYNKAMVPQAEKMRKALLDQYTQFRKLDPENPNVYFMWRKQFPEKAALLDEATRTAGYNSPMSFGQHNKLLPYDQYLSLSGEQKAMQAARDSNKSIEELRAEYPGTKLQKFDSKTWEGKTAVPEPLQIIRRGNDYSLPDLSYFKKGWK